MLRLVMMLMDHKDQQSPSQQRRQLQIAELIRNVWRFGKDFSVNEVKHVLGILSVNSFVIHDGAEEGLDLIGDQTSEESCNGVMSCSSGLYPWTSLISHCCVPNVKIITRDDFSYICEATSHIDGGSEIVTSYHHCKPIRDLLSLTSSVGRLLSPVRNHVPPGGHQTHLELRLHLPPVQGPDRAGDDGVGSELHLLQGEVTPHSHLHSHTFS